MSHRVSRMKNDSSAPYSIQWHEYRKRNRLFWFVFLTYIPAVLLIGLPLSWLFHSKLVAGIVAIMWAVAFMVTGNYRSYWKCPRCHKPFFQKWWYHHAFVERCVHCKLDK